MEKSKSRRKSNATTNAFCMPRLKGKTKKSNRVSPMSLLERFREAVFRLIMLSAISKAPNDQSRVLKTQRAYNYLNEPHHTEAVADCIEFIKKSATADEIDRESSASSSIDAAATPEVVIPVPVM